MDDDDNKKNTHDLEKELRFYKKRYKNALRDIQQVESVKENYEVFYQSSMQQQEELNKKLEKLAWFDSLTGLPNRKNFENFLNKSISRSSREDIGCALLFIDLDGFKDINDTFGHTTGDELLIKISYRLQEVIRNEDMLARLGGDEFVVIVTGLLEPVHTSFAAERIIKACEESVYINHKEINISASIGIALYPSNYEKTSELPAEIQLQQFADLAMYRAKQLGKNRYCYYDKYMTDQANLDLKLRKKIRNAIDAQEFMPAFQPIYSTQSKTIVGFEALARWPDANGQYVLPADFFPTLHKLNLAYELDFIILKKVFDYIKKIPDFFDHVQFITINFDAKTFYQKDCYRQLIQLLEQYQIKGENIVIELTETTLVQYNSHAIKTIEALAKDNIRLALDDFGTGYSGLSYLNRFPISIIKIDKFFSQSLPDEKFSVTIVKHLLDMAKDLNFQIVAEGVETQEQFQFYCQHQCDLLQGFLISKPIIQKDLNILDLIDDITKNLSSD